jgi:hypothetical protein
MGTNVILDWRTNLGNPQGLAISGNNLYIGSNNNFITQVNLTTNATPTQINGFNAPTGLAIDNTGTRMYVSNNDNNTISVVNLTNNSINPLNITPALEQPPNSIAFYNNTLYVVNGIVINQINLSNNASQTNWLGLTNVASLTINGNIMYVLINTNQIFQINLLQQSPQPVRLNLNLNGLLNPISIAVNNNILYIVDNGNSGRNSGSITQINLSTNVATTLVAGLNFPTGIVIGGQFLYVSSNLDTTGGVSRITLPNITTTQPTQSYLIGQPTPSHLNRSSLSGRGAMPVKDSTSDGTNSFSMDRRNYQRTLDSNPATNTINPNIRSLSQNPFGMFGGQQRMFFSQSKKQNTIAGEGPRYQAQKKWMGGSGGRDASQIAAKRRVNSVGNGSLNASNGQLAFMSRFNPNTNRDALIHVRDQGPSVQTKVRGRNLRTGMSVIS